MEVVSTQYLISTIQDIQNSHSNQQQMEINKTNESQRQKQKGGKTHSGGHFISFSMS